MLLRYQISVLVELQPLRKQKNGVFTKFLLKKDQIINIQMNLIVKWLINDYMNLKYI